MHYGDGPKDWVNVESRITPEDAIKYQTRYAKDVHDHVYNDEEEALADFISTHWAKILEEE